MGKIIKKVKHVKEYYEDPRCSGWISREVDAYYCNVCGKEIDSEHANFCPHCGEPLEGLIDEKEAQRKKAIKPFMKAYKKIQAFRDTLERNSLEYKYLTETLAELEADMLNL